VSQQCPYQRHFQLVLRTLIRILRPARVIPRLPASFQDNLSCTSRFQDSLSFFSAAPLAATLEKHRIVPTVRAVRFLLMHGSAPVFQ
jgi:hypothetical protein